MNDKDSNQNDCRNNIIDKTTGQIRTFLSELSNNTTNYRSLRNLTEQIEHQYHGRFLMELIQNAHDVLYDENHESDNGRLEIVVAAEEKPFGALYVANDGAPFTSSNFMSLSNFGQSDKDPEKSIGNKGIGFRSVLEICIEPEIYSRWRKKSRSFDGYCFRFSPNAVKLFKLPIQKLIEGEVKVLSPLDKNVFLVNWGEDQLNAFRNKYSDMENKGIEREMALLSPYLLPMPIEPTDRQNRIADFENQGFSTVIRLPFRSEEARATAIKHVSELNENSVLFLHKIKSLFLDSGTEQRFVERKKNPLGDSENGHRVDIFVIRNNIDTDVEKKQYLFWQSIVGGDDNCEEAEEIAKSVADLPGKWPEVRKAVIAFAVRLGNRPEKGLMNIYLSTGVTTGCWAHFNAPFYGDMSRTNIHLDQPYNELLLNKIAKKVVKVIFESLQGKKERDAAAILDLLSPIKGETGDNWWTLLNKSFEEKSKKMNEESLLLTDQGWRSICETSILPSISEAQVISDKLLRECAAFPAIVSGLSHRRDQILALFESAAINADPLEDDLSQTLENIANKLHKENKMADWNGFWSDIMKLAPKSKILVGKKILLGTDGQLHASGGSTTIFFRPRKGGRDDEVLAGDAIDDIPSNLRPYIAFLHENIRTHELREEGGYISTPLQKYLSVELVQPFQVEDIFREVLIQNMPPMPLPTKSKYQELCRDIIQWGLRLASRLFEKGKGESIMDLLGKLPVPCYGGWFTLNETSFGYEWKGTMGSELCVYLEATNSTESKEAFQRVMIPPTYRRWGGSKYLNKDILLKAGAFDGIRIRDIESDEWESQFDIHGEGKVELPDTAPPCFEQTLWNDYRKYIKETYNAHFIKTFRYTIDSLPTLPGLDKWEFIDASTKESFTRLIINSMKKWDTSWTNINIRKPEGRYDTYKVESTLHFLLRKLAWIALNTGESFEFFRPSDRWYINSRLLAGNYHQFEYLKPMPSKISSLLESDQSLLSLLKELDMPIYDPEKPSSNPRLLVDLAKALEDKDTEMVDMNVFLGHVRSAWSVFKPDEGNLKFPDQIIVNKGQRELSVLHPKNGDVFYLPDTGIADKEIFEFNSLPVVAIDVSDARSLSSLFKKIYKDKVQLISELTMRPLVEGKAWEPEKVDLLSENEKLSGLIPIILSVFAYHGMQFRGTQTKTFTKAMETLRSARICFEDNIERSVWRADECIVRAKTDAYWLSKERMLLCSKNVIENISLLSEALGALLERSDLDTALKLVFGRLEEKGNLSRENIVTILEQIHISESQLAEVEQLWRGKLSWHIRLLRPVIILFNPKADLNGFSEVRSAEDIDQLMLSFSFGPLTSDTCLSLVRKCRDFDELGRKLFEEIGDDAELQKWNEALKFADERIIKNDAFEDQFKDYLRSAGMPLRSIIRYHIQNNPDSPLFTELYEQLNSISCPSNFETKFWDVPFVAFIEEVINLFMIWNISPDIIDLISGTTKSPAELIQKLVSFGLEPENDPLEIYAKNQSQCRHYLEEIRRMASSWCIKNSISLEEWAEPIDYLMSKIGQGLKKLGYLSDLKYFQFLQLFRNVFYHDSQKDLWEKITAFSSSEDLQKNLCLTEEEMRKGQENLDAYKEKLNKQKRLINVCGKDFDCSEDNLGQLWEHIKSGIDDTDLPNIDLKDLATLEEMNKRKRSHKKNINQLQQKKYQGKGNQIKKDLIGLAGEIHAYRVLQKTFGSTVINPSSWISSNSATIFPENKTDDSFGCDFVFENGGKKYHVEVKATEDDDEAFELGSTEIRHAVEIVNMKKIKFVILHIIKALTATPDFRLLPNPYDSKSQKYYRIEEAGLRIRYKCS